LLPLHLKGKQATGTQCVVYLICITSYQPVPCLKNNFTFPAHIYAKIETISSASLLLLPFIVCLYSCTTSNSTFLRFHSGGAASFLVPCVQHNNNSKQQHQHSGNINNFLMLFSYFANESVLAFKNVSNVAFRVH